MSPFAKFLLALSTVLCLANCGANSGDNGGEASGGGGGGGGGPATDVQKLALKNDSVKKVLLGHVVDLRLYLKNYEAAEYQVIDGKSRVEWMALNVPKLRFHSAGEAVVLVTDTRDLRSVILKLKGVFDTSEIIEEPGSPIEELPDPVGPVIHL